ncbi:MAG: hypothetical protein ACPGTU_14130 [Myxococcota bacterium]
MSQGPSLRTRLTIMAASTAITFLLAEGLVRLADGNAAPMIRLFEQAEDGDIRLEQNGEARIISPRGEPWTLQTNADGYRRPSSTLSSEAWIAVGDSQVMGNGVDGHAPFPAQTKLDGSHLHNAGVPGYGIADALWLASRHLDAHPAKGVIVVVNQMNDWDEAEAQVGNRYTVRGGWLLDSEDAAGPRGSFLASPLSSSHLLFLVGHLMLRDWDPSPPTIPAWMSDPAGQRATTLRFAHAIKQFQLQHPDTRVVPVYLPADLYAASDRLSESPLTPHVDQLSTPPWDDTRLRDQVMFAFADLDILDLTPTLQGRADAFLTGDYHLSEQGHALVARAIEAHVSELQEPVGPETQHP